MDISYIREQFKKSGYRVAKTAREVDLDYEVVESIFGLKIEPPRRPKEPRPPDIRQLGKIGLRRWVIAVKGCHEPSWPDEFKNPIKSAQYKYDAGTHEMYQETRNGWNILYCQPRKKPVPLRSYFTERAIG